MISALDGANPQFGQSQEDKIRDLDHSNPELCSSATHYDVLGPCGRRSPVKEKGKNPFTCTRWRQTVSECVCVCVCVESRPEDPLGCEHSAAL